MPKTAVQEHSYLASGEYDVGGPSEVGQRTNANAIPEPTCVERSPQGKLWARIPTAVSLHPDPHFSARCPGLIRMAHLDTLRTSAIEGVGPWEATC